MSFFHRPKDAVYVGPDRLGNQDFFPVLPHGAIQHVDQFSFVDFGKFFSAKHHRHAIDERAEGLHQIAAEVERIVLVVVLETELGEVAGGDDFPIEKGQEDGIAVVQSPIQSAGIPPGETFSAQGIEIDFRRRAFPIGHVAGQDVFLVLGEHGRFRGMSPFFQDEALLTDFLADNDLPYLRFSLFFPADLHANAAAGFAAADIGNELGGRIVFFIAKDDFDFAAGALIEPDAGHRDGRCLQDDGLHIIQKDALRLLSAHDHVAHGVLELGTVGDDDGPPAHLFGKRRQPDFLFKEAGNGLPHENYSLLCTQGRIQPQCSGLPRTTDSRQIRRRRIALEEM